MQSPEAHDVFDALTGMLKQGIRRSQALTEFVQSVQFEFEHPPDGPVVLVHEMARAGAARMLGLLLERFPRANVYHTHYLNPASIRWHHGRISELFRRTGQAGLYPEFMAARTLAARLRSGTRPPWKVITAVPDPVERTISAFFHNFRINHPDFEEGYQTEPAHIDRLIPLFLSDDELERTVTLEWFGREVRDVFGVDVFQRPFPRESGYDVHRSDACEMLLIRTADLDRVGPGAVGRFLNTPGPRFDATEGAEVEPYREARSEFEARIRLPSAYLDAMYGSRLARHFFSPAEIDEARERWVNG